MIKKRQSGLTMISWVVVLAYLAVQAIMGMRIIPVYLNYNAVKSVMNELVVDPSVKGMTGKKLSDLFRKRLRINNLYDLAKDKKAFKFKKTKKGYHLTANYEEGGPIWGNLKFVADFKHEVDIPTR